MCSVTLGLVVASGIATIAGGIQESRAKQQQANFQGAVARNNEIISRRLADDARARGVAEAEARGIQGQDEVARLAARTREFISRQRVSQVAFGQAVDVGSALDLTADTAAVGKLEELTTRRNVDFERRVIQANAEREAIGFLTQGVNFAAEARLARLQASSARRAGIISTVGTVLTTAGTVASKWKPRKIPTLPPLPSPFGTAEAVFR